MRVLLKLVIDCDADAAWRAVHSPRAVAELYGPLLALDPLVPNGLPTSWSPGDDVPVQLSALGIVPMGRQLIHMSERRARGPARTRADLPRQRHPAHRPPRRASTYGITRWRSRRRRAIPTKTLWRDRLVIGGPTAAALWPLLWATWQWRGARIRALAPTWAHDLPVESPAPSPEAAPDPDAPANAALDQHGEADADPTAAI